jgi:hypothetical protein
VEIAKLKQELFDRHAIAERSQGCRIYRFAAGPAVGKHLADHGATVVHIESRVRPDGFRTHYPPYKDNIHGLNRSGLFALINNVVGHHSESKESAPRQAG